MQRTFVEVFKPKSPASRVQKLLCGARHVVALTLDHKVPEMKLCIAYSISLIGIFALQVLTWGIGSQGQLGRIPAFQHEQQPSSGDLFVPQEVPGLDVLLGSDPVDIGVGLYNSFAFSASGDVVGWGLNNSGQLGVPKKDQDDNLTWSPVKIEGLKEV